MLKSQVVSTFVLFLILKYLFLEIVWYKDDKVIKTNENYLIEHKDKLTICKIPKAKKELEGIYKCKAVSDIGMAITKATLQVFESEEKIEKNLAQRTKTEVLKKEEVIKTDEENLKSEVQTEENEREKVQPSRKEFARTETTSSTVIEADYVEITDKATLKKVEDGKKIKKPSPRNVEPVVVPSEYLITSEQQKDEVVKTLDKFVYDSQKAIIKTVEESTNMVAEINELLELLHAKEFGPGESTLRELAKIGYLLRSGVTTEQIETLYDSEYFPALRMPQSQAALVQLVEREGHSALITNVFTQETVQEEDVIASKVGFKAFMNMVELRHATVEEVISHLYPQDFEARSWEEKEAQEVKARLFFFLDYKTIKNMIRKRRHSLII